MPIRPSQVLLAAFLLAACGHHAGPEDMSPPPEAPCHTMVHGTLSRIILDLDADGGAPIRVVTDRGEERTLGSGPLTFDTEQEELVLRAVGTPELELRFGVGGDEPTAVVLCAPHCEARTKSTRTGHNTGEVESEIVLPPSFGGRVVHMHGRMSISVAECH